MNDRDEIEEDSDDPGMIDRYYDRLEQAAGIYKPEQDTRLARVQRAAQRLADRHVLRPAASARPDSER